VGLAAPGCEIDVVVPAAPPVAAATEQIVWIVQIEIWEAVRD